MHSPQILQPDNLIKLANRIGETLFCREVIPGCKGVCCIKTDTYPLFFIYLFNDFSQVLKPVAHIGALAGGILNDRSEEHTSELQSRGHLVCRLLLEKKKKDIKKKHRYERYREYEHKTQYIAHSQ